MGCAYVHVQYDLMNICVRQTYIFYDSHFKPLNQLKCCGDLIDNRSNEPICVLAYKKIYNKIKLIHALKEKLEDCLLCNIST